MTANHIDILLVEDNDADVELILNAFGSDGVVRKVHVMKDGEEALRYLLNDENPSHPLPSLLLLDLKLPKVSGLDVLRQLRVHGRTRTLPVVIFTSSKEERDVAEAYSLGANSYVQKPVDFEEFRDTLRQLGRYWLVINEPTPDLGLVA